MPLEASLSSENGKMVMDNFHMNQNCTFIDDDFECERIRIPFLVELGRQLVLK